MRARAPILIVSGLSGLALAVVPALAADTASVSVLDNSFSPGTVSVDAGGTVTWTNAPGGFNHNVRFSASDTEPSVASNEWEFSRTFPSDSTVQYVCGVHGASMSGTVIVGEGSTTTTTTTTTTPTPTATTDPVASPTPAPETFTAVPTRKHFCARAGKRCSRAGFVVEIDLDAPEPREIAGTLRRAGKRVGTVRVTADPGITRHRFKRVAGKRLKSGRYRLDLTLGDATQTVRFRVRG